MARLLKRFGTTPSDLLATLGYRLGYFHLDGYPGGHTPTRHRIPGAV